MADPIPDKFKDILQQPSFAFLGTVMPDGTPHVTPVWFDWDGKNILINTAKGRVKDRNMRANPCVAVTIMDTKNPYRYLQIRGKVTDITEQGADAHIDKLAKKYLNVEKYPNRAPGEVRVMYRITPDRCNTMG